jgi:hypothetical protein
MCILTFCFHFQMARPCTFCGVCIQDPEELEFHEQLHELDFLEGIVSVFGISLHIYTLLNKYISPKVFY